MKITQVFNCSQIEFDNGYREEFKDLLVNLWKNYSEA